MASVHTSPKYTKFRVVTVDDTSASIPNKANGGLAFAGYDIGNVQVIPTGGANPSIEILSWCPKLETYISVYPKAEFPGQGADTPFEITFSPYNRTVWIFVTGTGTGQVELQVCGDRLGS